MRKKELINQSLTVILVICAVLITGLIIRREFSSPSNDRPERTVENWQELDFLTLPASKRSPSDSQVQIIKFYDYECPYCKQVQSSLQAVLEKYENDISIYYAHLPLQSHEHAYKAAMAAECARNQGYFKNYDSLLFAYQSQLNSLSYVDYAIEAGVKDLSTFSQCLENEETKMIVDRGMDLAQKMNISSIPTFIINGRVIPGALSEESLIGIIEEELAKTK